MIGSRHVLPLSMLHARMADLHWRSWHYWLWHSIRRSSTSHDSWALPLLYHCTHRRPGSGGQCCWIRMPWRRRRRLLARWRRRDRDGDRWIDSHVSWLDSTSKDDLRTGLRRRRGSRRWKRRGRLRSLGHGVRRGVMVLPLLLLRMVAVRARLEIAMVQVLHVRRRVVSLSWRHARSLGWHAVRANGLLRRHGESAIPSERPWMVEFGRLQTWSATSRLRTSAAADRLGGRTKLHAVFLSRSSRS